MSSYFDEYAKESIDLQALLDKAFLTNGRLFHHDRILCWFPKYLQLTKQTNELLMENKDVLPITWKYYIAIMAVSCYDCEYKQALTFQIFVEDFGRIILAERRRSDMVDCRPIEDPPQAAEIG